MGDNESRMWKGLRPNLLLAAVLITAAALVWQMLPVGRSNLIIVLVDTTRADRLGYQGYSRETSPHIDALAEQSVVFLKHYAPSSRTGPSVASLFTGLHPRSHGVLNPLDRFDAKGTLMATQTTLAEILTANGYLCGGFVANINVHAKFGFAQGFESYGYVPSTAAPDVNRFAFKLLKEMVQKEAPFFLYLHYLEPHSSYRAPAPYDRMFVDTAYGGELTGAHEQLDEIVAGKRYLDDLDIAQLNALYDQEIRYFDDQFGELVAFLKREGLMEGTVLLFLSDHGEEFLDHGSALHGYTLYEEQLLVPAFIYDQRLPPRQVTSITRQVDLFPTLMELLDVSDFPPVQGRSLLDVMNGKADPWKRPVFAEASLRAVKTVRMESLLVDGWKLIVSRLPEPRQELFHLTVDPAEEQNLIDAAHRRAREMREELGRFRQSLPTGQHGTVELSEEEIEKLRSLGYIQ